MTLLIVGSIAFDSVETPFGKRDRMLGGAAIHTALSASFFTSVRIVGIVGKDFADQELDILHDRGIDTEDVERVHDGLTFYWRGRYDEDLSTAETLETQLNVFGDFSPKLSPASASTETVFLANIQPDLQRQVREQCREAVLVGLDSMNLWIDTARDSLVDAMRHVDAVLLNDGEVRLLTNEPNLARAARQIGAWGPRVVVVKHAEHGATLFSRSGFFAIPGCPLDTVVDPTGAGDSFAGGFLGYLDGFSDPRSGEDLPDEALRRAVTYGCVMGSFNVEEFGTERVMRLTREEIDARFEGFRRMTHIGSEPTGAPNG